MTALDEKAADGALPYGAPQGATGTAAYDFVLAGATSASQDNTTRGVAAIALLALASASGMFVRRRVLSQ
jgi:putative membrane protein